MYVCVHVRVVCTNVLVRVEFESWCLSPAQMPSGCFPGLFHNGSPFSSERAVGTVQQYFNSVMAVLTSTACVGNIMPYHFLLTERVKESPEWAAKLAERSGEDIVNKVQQQKGIFLVFSCSHTA